jgi:hypothetical protein
MEPIAKPAWGMQICFLNQMKVGNGGLKSPFSKGDLGGFPGLVLQPKSPLTPLYQRGELEGIAFKISLWTKEIQKTATNLWQILSPP